MINKWILNNFKSVSQDKALELAFRPLTLFTGANSSGKSTILQSILLVTQTIQSPIASRSIVLNGWFKKFGSYSDVVYAREDKRNIRIGFSIFDKDVMRDMYFLQRRMLLDDLSQLTDLSGRWIDTECVFEFSSNGQKDNIHPELENVQIRAMLDGKSERRLEAHKVYKRSEEEQKVLETIKSQYRNAELNYTLNTTQPYISPFPKVGVTWKPIGVKFDHFMPKHVIAYCTRVQHMIRSLRLYLLMGGWQSQELEEVEKEIVPLIKEKAMEIVEQLHKEELIKGKDSEKTYASIKVKFTLKKLQSIFKNCALIDQEKRWYITQITDKLNNLPEEFHVEPRPIITQTTDLIRSFFQNRINYLGPLREEPKSLYPLGNDGSTTDVGLKGENTAAVYDYNKHETVSYIDPQSFASSDTSKWKKRKGTLEEAVNKWLVYMGVAHDVMTNDRGKMGHSMQISNDLNIRQDLTHVGVGVSQVLPILVMSLLADEGDVIILEQPELHLHPKVQTRLADFFISLTATHKQCIVETHSEYMINRLRYLVAKSDDNKVAEDTMIYFVEKKDGKSNYRPVTINKYGVIEDWPDGFFDESEKIAEEVLRAGMEKKMKEDGDNFEE